MSTELELLTKAKELFLAERAKQEMSVAAWAEKISKLPDDVKVQLRITDDITLQKLIPELYADNPDEATYDRQYTMMTAWMKECNDYADATNKEAKACLSDYEALLSKRNS